HHKPHHERSICMRPRPGTSPADDTNRTEAAARTTGTGRASSGGGGGRGPGRPRRPGTAAANPARNSRPGTMRHKGYTAKVGYDDDAGVLRGEVVDLQDEIRFSATS